MDKRACGSGFKKQAISLVACPACKGRAVMSGVFYEIDCIQCHASGWVRFDNGQALELQELVTQLGINLRIASKQIEQHMTAPSFDVPDYYSQNNRRGAGGTNYTGD